MDDELFMKPREVVEKVQARREEAEDIHHVYERSGAGYSSVCPFFVVASMQHDTIKPLEDGWEDREEAVRHDGVCKRCSLAVATTVDPDEE